MNRSEFVLVTLIVLVLAFALGWFANWLVHRFTRVSQADLGELERMAQALHEAEETRDQAIAWIQHREDEVKRETAQLQAELRAAMEGLRDARQEVAMLRHHIESQGR
jgi:phage/plasmid-associated DNA primase